MPGAASAAASATVDFVRASRDEGKCVLFSTHILSEAERLCDRIGVIHGGENSLRFTPHFGITREEAQLIIDATRHALLNGPVKASPSAPTPRFRSRRDPANPY